MWFVKAPCMSHPKRSRAGLSVDASLAALAGELLRLEGRLVELEQDMQPVLARVPAEHRESARNLVHYVALRQVDLRELQGELQRRGLSSLGRSESCVLRSVVEVSLRAHEALALRGDEGAPATIERLEKAGAAALSWSAAQHLLHQHTRDTLGPRPEDRHISIMVTAPSAAEADAAWMAKLLRAGMNVLRVNCAHEDEAAWGRMVEALAQARRKTGKDCQLLMDLAGPKIRTGGIEGARRIATWKPVRSELGRVTAPARVELWRPSLAPADGPQPLLLLDEDTFAALRAGDTLHLEDTRGKARSLTVDEVRAEVVVALGSQHTYLLDQVEVRVERDGKRLCKGTLRVGGAADAALELSVGDPLLLTSRDVRGHGATRGADGKVDKPALIACTLGEALQNLELGQRVSFDDGKLEAVVEAVKKHERDYLLRVVRTQRPLVKLRPEKGINLPDTEIEVASLTDEDRRALPFVAKHADVVGLSFARKPDDIRALHEELERLGRPHIGLVLKIETRAGFENLPRLLLAGMMRPPVGVMIARGDLAVEVGFERLAELQEEILWLCEAAHVPAIWATQVLDTLARTGVPSRAEVTDAAASVAAECVMLNKGPFVAEAVGVLSDILRRMEKHHYKKRSLYRKLRVSKFA
jgi:pyruvate kinase